MPGKKSNRKCPKGSGSAASVNILLGVSGGVAAYKSVDLASRLTAGGAKVNTIMTDNACQLIGPKSFEAVTGQPVYTSLWSAGEEYKIGHVSLTDWADIIVVAPATANIIGKIANGICDDLLSTTLCVCWPLIKSGAAILAPAMNDNMWNNPAVQRNISTIKEMGFQLIGPVEGRLACGTEGIGRMAESQDILKAIEKIALKIKRQK
ncbi:MAG: flavoprotein [Phycisphaerae bacterium]|jgi:phosphopantothenoylcysteine decarboxylase/phosphopantothenate--cysteine ligase